MAELTNPEPLSAEVQQAFAEIRTNEGLRALTADESGGGVDKLPNGVYGFTYSPAADNFPLFTARDLRSYEGHKRKDGAVMLLGFLDAAEKTAFETTSGDATIHLYAEPKGEAKELVQVPMSRVRGHVEHSQRGEQGIELTIGAAG